MLELGAEGGADFCCMVGSGLQQLIRSLPRLQVLKVSKLECNDVDLSLPSLTSLHINEMPIFLLPDLLEAQLPALQTLWLGLSVGDEWSPPRNSQFHRLQQLVQLGRADGPYCHFDGELSICGPVRARELGMLSFLRGTAQGLSLFKRIQKNQYDYAGNYVDQLMKVRGNDVALLASAVGVAAADLRHLLPPQPLHQ